MWNISKYPSLKETLEACSHASWNVTATADNILFVLETPQGWFKRHGVTTGAAITTEKGSLMKTFWNR